MRTIQQFVLPNTATQTISTIPQDFNLIHVALVGSDIVLFGEADDTLTPTYADRDMIIAVVGDSLPEASLAHWGSVLIGSDWYHIYEDMTRYTSPE